MIDKEILKLYDYEMRKNAPVDINQAIESTEYVTRMVSTNHNSGENCLIYSHLNQENVNSSIEE